MKITSTAAAAAAFVVCSQDFASASPVGGRVQKRDTIYEITTLGGMTFKISQVPNKKFYGQRRGRGSMAIARAYSKFGQAVPDDLLTTIEQILEELGLLGNTGSGNSTTDDDQGLFSVALFLLLWLINL